MLKVLNAEEAVRIAADQALRASLSDTFAVGGALVSNNTGEVYCALHNDVLKSASGAGSYRLYDPTGHGERQLVDWYFEHRESQRLPNPAELTIVTTLDPCAMCAGAILTAGFNVAVSAEDGYAGINYDKQLAFRSLPETWQEVARERFGYYAVCDPISRLYAGSKSIAFADESLDSLTFTLTDVIFDDSVNKIRSLDNNSGLEPGKLKDPKSLPVESKVIKSFREAFPDALRVRSSPRLPESELARPLYDAAIAAKKRGAGFNSVAFLDPFGNLLLCLGGREDRSPIRTAFLEVTRIYARIRWNLMNDADPEVRQQAEASLTHPKYGTFVFLYAPDTNSPQGLLELGAYGSTMEGAIPQVYPSSFQFVFLPSHIEVVDIAKCTMSLPPFYTTSVQISPMRTLSQRLQLDLTSLMDES